MLPKDIGTWIRLSLLILALVNQVLAAKGLSPLPIEEGQVENLVSSAVTIVVGFLAYYKNNNHTEEARIGTKVGREMKRQIKNGEDTVEIEKERAVRG